MRLDGREVDLAEGSWAVTISEKWHRVTQDVYRYRRPSLLGNKVEYTLVTKVTMPEYYKIRVLELDGYPDNETASLEARKLLLGEFIKVRDHVFADGQFLVNIIGEGWKSLT